MKDAYSFDRDLEGLQQSYDAMYAAYEEVFTRCGLTFRSVKAQSGEIGGDTSQEFMAVAAVGEDAFVWCESCDYAANTEAATKQELPEQAAPADAPAIEKLHTPDLPGIERGREAPQDKAEPAAEGDRVRRRRRPRPRDRSRQPRGERVRARRALSRYRRSAAHRRRLRRTSRSPEGLHRPGLRRREVRDRRLVGPRATPVDHRRERGRPSREGISARPRLHADAVGRDRDRRAGRRLPEVRSAIAHRPGHRGRPRLPARHEVHRSRSARSTRTRRASSTPW